MNLVNPLTMFTEKDTPGGKPAVSMTRTVAFIFCLTVCYAIVLYARAPQQLGWPFAVVCIVTLLAVPIQMLFKWLHSYTSTRAGSKLLAQLAEAAAGKLAPGAAAIVRTIGGETTVEATPAPASPAPDTSNSNTTTTDAPASRGAAG